MLVYSQTIEGEREKAGKNHCKSDGTTYDLAQLVVNGRAMDPTNVSVTLTTPGLKLYGQSFIFAVNEEYALRIAVDGGRRGTKPDLVKHETLFHNANVRAAGEIEIRDGIVVDVNSASGTYNPDETDLIGVYPLFAQALLTALARAKIDVDEQLEKLLMEKGRDR